MKTEKLFGLLVVGGALWVTQSALPCGVPEPIEEEAEPLPAFCSPFNPELPDDQNTCVIDDQGKQVVRQGLVCCWATSCDAQ